MATDLDEELLEQQEIEQEQAEDFAAAQQQERMQRIQQQRIQQAPRVQKVADTAKTAQKWFKRYEKAGVVLELLVATFPVWGTILAVCAGAMFVMVVLIAGCNQAGLSGAVTRGASTVAGFFGADICDNLMFSGGRSGGAGASVTYKLEIVITSAYRPGAIVAGTNRQSAHARGEAVDIALRNPIVPKYGDDVRVAQLVQIVTSAGFNPILGDTIDEYTNSLEGTTGGHVHVEFNTETVRGETKTYCDDTIVKNPPTDLVAIPASIPVAGGDPRLRPCMLDAVIAIFNAARGPAPVTTP